MLAHFLENNWRYKEYNLHNIFMNWTFIMLISQNSEAVYIFQSPLNVSSTFPKFLCSINGNNYLVKSLKRQVQLFEDVDVSRVPFLFLFGWWHQYQQWYSSAIHYSFYIIPKMYNSWMSKYCSFIIFKLVLPLKKSFQCLWSQ